MRLSIPAVSVLATIPSLVSAQGLLGFALGNKLPSGACKTTADYQADFDAISAASSSRIVRTYAANDCNTAQQIIPAAKAKSFTVILGVWYVELQLWNVPVGALLKSRPSIDVQTQARRRRLVQCRRVRSSKLRSG